MKGIYQCTLNIRCHRTEIWWAPLDYCHKESLPSAICHLPEISVRLFSDKNAAEWMTVTGQGLFARLLFISFFHRATNRKNQIGIRIERLYVLRVCALIIGHFRFYFFPSLWFWFWLFPPNHVWSKVAIWEWKWRGTRPWHHPSWYQSFFSSLLFGEWQPCSSFKYFCSSGWCHLRCEDCCSTSSALPILLPYY